MKEEERIYVVDRIEGSQIVLIGDDNSESVLNPLELPVRVSEGTVLRVRLVVDKPDWSTAAFDREEQERRLADAKRRMDELRKKDPGGDLKL